MDLENIGEVIAIREMTFVDKAGSRSKLTVSIGKPQPFPDSDNYYCPFKISGAIVDRIKYAAGLDAIQALQLVMTMIGANLAFLAEKLEGELSWEGGSDGELGFPMEHFD